MCLNDLERKVSGFVIMKKKQCPNFINFKTETRNLSFVPKMEASPEWDFKTSSQVHNSPPNGKMRV